MSDEREVLGELRDLRDVVRKLSDRLAKREDPLFAEGRRYLRRELDKLSAGSAPIVVGPWTGEVGFELLYWIPFVRWAIAEFRIDPRRLVLVSRGGVASWYGIPDVQYADIFDIVPPAEFGAATTASPSLKQRERSALDERIIAAVAAHHELGDPKVLHPGAMFRAFKQFWDDEVGFERIEEFTRHQLLEPAAAERPHGLPVDYIAARFYFRRSFPDTPANRALASGIVQALAQSTPVVVLTSGVKVDDHSDWIAAAGRNVLVLGDAPAARNLAVQSAVISGARAFVGTYGGFSYLAPLYRVPAVAFYSRHAFEGNHLYVAQRVFDRIGAARLTEVDAAQAELIGAALAGVAAAKGSA